MNRIVQLLIAFAIIVCFIATFAFLLSIHGTKKAIVRVSDMYEIKESGDTLLIIKK